MSLKDWFGKGPKGDWVRMGTDGKIKGPCAREPGEGKPKCLPRSKASSMSLKDRASAVRRKRREDPVADRKGKGGKPVNVKTHKEEIEYIEEKSKPTNPALWSRAKAAARAKFDVYPSAYANGWAVRWYKKRGGGWRDVAEEVVNEKCWDGYTQAGMKKKGKKVVPNCVPESESLGLMIARAQSKRIKSDWSKLSPDQKLASLRKDREDLKKRMADHEKSMKEGKNHSWKSEGHYTKDGKEWKGPQHAHDGQVMTGEKHTADSQDLYHFKQLSKDVQKKVLAKIQKEEIELLEKLNPSMGIGKYIKDFKKSDAPQFKGASASKRRKMAVAAYLGAKRKKMSEAIDYNPQEHEWGKPEGTDQMKSLTPGQKNPKEAPMKALDTSTLVALNVKDEYVKEEAAGDESKKKYREDNAELAPEAGIVPLSKDDIANLYAEIDSMSYEQMEDYGFWDDDEDDDVEYDSNIEWDDFDMDEVDIMEVLSVQGRLKRRFAARKNRQKLKVARNIALRRGSSPDRLKKRATRGARSMVYKRLLKGRDKASMPPAEKARFERLIGMYQPLIQRFAQRMLPKMRKMEISRMKSRAGKKPQKSKKYKVARPVAKASSQKAKKFKIKR